MFVIKRDVDVNGTPLKENEKGLCDYWCGQRGGGWGWPSSAQQYETRKLAEQAIKRNSKSNWSFKRGHAYIVELAQAAA